MSFASLIGVSSMLCLLPSSFSSQNLWARTQHAIFCFEMYLDSILRKSKAIQTYFAPFFRATTAAR